jgi:hypothetical protein
MKALRSVRLLSLAAMLVLAGCDGGGGTESRPEDEIFRVNAVTENFGCGATSCSVDIRGTARDADGVFISGATIFTYVRPSNTGTEVAGPSATTNGSGAYVITYTFPATGNVDYSVWICAGTAVRPRDERCTQVYFSLA